MRLRKYISSDSAVICSWIRDEISLYQWSADRIELFPLPSDALDKNYSGAIGDRFIPLTAVDENGIPVGHLLIRYPDENDDTVVRFGFVIVSPELRGCGNGKKLLELAIAYVKEQLSASLITLGVFDNNPSAKRCYLSVGFLPSGITESYSMPVGDWSCTEMELHL
ncbi:MAG: GNAT family N-acetyltransferase [Oscillospiraceae bacterium]|nr:GNAT family N-acetyltransferase [Oscillospiraceae bacterium]